MSKKYEIIYNDLCNQIKCNVLTAGAKLPTEMELTKLYNCSRITVITALNKLKDENMIFSIKKSGTFVNGSTKNFSIRIFALILPFDTDFSLDIIDEAQRYALLNNIFISVYSSGNNTIKEKEILTTILTMQVDGLIIYPCSSLNNADILSAFIIKNIPIVFLDRAVLGIDSPLITSNNEDGMKNITDLLIKNEHRNIGFFSAYDSSLQTVKDRFSGYCKSLILHKIPINSNIIFTCNDIANNEKISSQKKLHDYINVCAKKYLEQFTALQNKPTAICCINDYCAFEIIDVFSSVKNLTITGFDKIKNFAQNKLIASAQQNFRKMATTAIDTILKIILNLPFESVQKISTELIN